MVPPSTADSLFCLLFIFPVAQHCADTSRERKRGSGEREIGGKRERKREGIMMEREGQKRREKKSENKHKAELQRTDPGTTVTDTFSTNTRISPRELGN